MPRTLAAALLALTACSNGPSVGHCAGIACGACPPPITLTIVTSDGSTPSVSGDVELACSTTGDTTTCFATSDVQPGTYSFAVTTPSGASQDTSLTLGAGDTGCCACPVQEGTAEVRFDTNDAGAADDGGASDAGSTPDASASAADAGLEDASADAAVSCRPDRVEFPMGGDLSPGTYCDALFVCVADASAAAAVEAASSAFDCTVGPGDPCTGGVRCAYGGVGGGSTFEEAEIAAICAVTVLEPPPDRVLCRVYV